MDKDTELYLEEQRQASIDLLLVTKELHNEIKTLRESYEAPRDRVEVSGNVSVNTEKSVELINPDAISKGIIDKLEDVIIRFAESVEKNKAIIPNKFIVENIADAITKEVSVLNQPDMNDFAQKLIRAIEENKTEYSVQKVEFPTSPSKPIAVRLSDGKSFYKAIFNAVASAGNKAPDDSLADYQITDRDESTATKYYGYVKANGAWYILRELNGAYRYAKGAPLPNGGGLYTDAWNDKINLTYGYLYEVF